MVFSRRAPTLVFSLLNPMGGGAFCRLVEGLAFTIATPDCWTKSCSSMVPDAGFPAWWGRFPLGVPFERAKGTKTRLGRSPLRTSLGYAQYRGVDSTRRGKAPPLAILSPISHRGEMGPSGARPQAGQPESSISWENAMMAYKMLCCAIF